MVSKDGLTLAQKEDKSSSTFPASRSARWFISILPASMALIISAVVGIKLYLCARISFVAALVTWSIENSFRAANLNFKPLLMMRTPGAQRQ